MKKYTAELIGTFALVLVGAGAGCLLNENTNSLAGLRMPGFASLLMVALAHGLTLMGMIYALGHLSGGHFNPAVTVTALVCNKISLKDSLGYILSQLAGAALAGWMLKQLFSTVIGTGYLGATSVSDTITPNLGLLCEAVGTFLFFTVIFGTAGEGRPAGNFAGLAIGLTLAGLILFFGPLTGASFNPARTFGPALASGHWNSFWIYVLGPILGGSCAGILQTKVLNKN